MQASPAFPPRGWSITGWTAAAVAVMVGLVFAVVGIGEEGIRAGIRATARSSLLLFAPVFAASALHRRWPTASWTRWLRGNRRYLGVSFAVSHFTHLGLILWLVAVSPEFGAAVDAVTIVFGGGAYVFLAAMTLTSFDATARLLSPPVWQRLHRSGAYVLWLVFFVSYAPRAIEAPVYWPTVILLVAAIGVRWATPSRVAGSVGATA